MLIRLFFYFQVTEQAPKKKKPREYKLKIFVGFLFILIVVGIAIIYHYYHNQLYLIDIGTKIRFKENTRELFVENVDGTRVLYGRVGMDIDEGMLPFDCTDPDKKYRKVCLWWKNEAGLKIDYEEQGKTKCYRIMWDPFKPQHSPHDCYDLKGAHWYGGFLQHTQKFPLEQMHERSLPFVTGSIHGNQTYGPVVERYWLSSKGAAIFVDYDSPLMVSFNNENDDRLCLSMKDKNYVYTERDDKLLQLNYTICVDYDILRVHDFVLSQIRNTPRRAPDSRLFMNPVWSTWAYMHKAVNTSSVLAFAQKIMQLGLSCSQFVLEDGWEKAYGDLEFDDTKFPTPNTTMARLKSLGYDLTLAVHPFVNTESKAFQEAITNNFFIRDAGGLAPGLTEWNHGPLTDAHWINGMAGVIDFSNIAATEWYTARLRRFQQKYGISSFRFLAGEVSSLPFRPNFASELQDINMYSTLYTHVASQFGNNVHIQSGYQSQDIAGLLHVYGKYSTWEYENGLKSVIPGIITLGLIGYPFVLPDVIGGNAFEGFPSRDLYIRWMQLATFLPIMHFSIPPWHYDQETVQIAKDLIKFHQEHIVPEVLLLSENATSLGHPIIRPLWWADPKDEEAQQIDTQFLIGNDILVAPVLEEDTQRNIYLPEGKWKDVLRGGVKKGKQWIYKYEVKLKEFAYFIRESDLE